MPGPQQVVGQDLGEIEPEEAVDLSAVVLGRGSDERLDQEQRGHHEEEPRCRPLCGRQRDVARRAEGERRLLAAVPPEVAPQRPKAANSRPIPTSNATSDTTDQTSTFAVGLLSTRDSRGQLFV